MSLMRYTLGIVWLFKESEELGRAIGRETNGWANLSFNDLGLVDRPKLVKL